MLKTHMQQDSNVYSFTMHARVNLKMVIPTGDAYVVVGLAHYSFTFLPDLRMNVPEDSYMYHHFNVSQVQFYSFVD